jgi:alkylation response protein AidB-like acyl-CoA dehydrogenase
MDLRDTPELAQFRRELRQWLVENVPQEPEPQDMVERFAFARAWQSKLYAGGWCGLSWPTEYGGRGFGPLEEAVASEEMARAGAPATFPSTHLGRALLEYGNEDQRRRYLPGLLNAGTIWCQGFSEPGAGSDLASLSTRATRDGDSFVLSGEKTWTSFGRFAEYSMVLARSDPTAPKHRGISAFIVPLDSPGISVQPIRIANGDEEFVQLFLDDVVVPAENLLGEMGQGWPLALSTVSYERGAVDLGYQVKFERYFTELVEQCKQSAALIDGTTDDAMGAVAVQLEVLRMHCLRRLSDRARTGSPGPASSGDKLFITWVEQDLMDVATRLVAPPGDEAHRLWFDRYLYGRAGSIYGGSSQIQRSILAERVLGLRFRP